MKQSKFPAGWDEQKVRRVLKHYEQQTEEEAVAEDEAVGTLLLMAKIRFEWDQAKNPPARVAAACSKVRSPERLRDRL